MKKTNIILGIVIAIFVICAVFILVNAVISNKPDDTVPVNVDFAALSSEIEESTNFDSSKMKQITIDDLQNEFSR